ncbi:CGNR zinc finger domain-containing protein [Streptomyces hesseae]|uniref:CGNR zinc finger domain-containing protein n=1 Tax=Streptomyces hesseae TaxID=3075519 RepID=A0ABU2SL24_9ACTN|nr:CGNR zinc finger domain-containing protein [Streptomyces sp. DSM 40473]MDT0449682.1 CGNR zinc finger domain-containing protein [Streptomyces sp. DSM 40473]
MTWPATARYGLEAAPGRLGLVQDLLNTAAVEAPGSVDLLAAPDDARAWADAAVARWTAVTGQPVPPVRLDAEEAEKLRAFRDDLRRMITEGAGDEPGAGLRAMVPYRGSAALRLGEDGVVRLEPCGSGRRLLAALVLVAVFEAQRDGTWGRLKACRAPRCRVAFYDRSRNNSGVWHEVKSCGNAANLRACRARRRAREAGPGAKEAPGDRHPHR